MRKMSEQDHLLCTLQANIFEESLSYSKSSSAVFVRRFMRSQVASRMDNGSFAFESNQPAAVISEVESEYNEKAYGSQQYSRNEMHWIGYFYRALCQTTGMSSKAAYRIIGARELKGLYIAYHTLDVEQAVERVLEAKGMNKESQIERGVRILRAIRGL